MKTKIIRQMLIPALLLIFLASAGLAQADTWKQQYLVKKSTHKERNVDSAVMDTDGNKFFHAYEANSPDAFSNSFLYEYTTKKDWVNHSDDLQSLVAGHVNWQDSANWGINSLYADKLGNVWVGMAPCTLAKYDGSNWSVISAQSVWEEVLGTTVTGINGGYFYYIMGDTLGNIYSIASVSATGMGSQDTLRVIKRDVNGAWSTAISPASLNEVSGNTRLKGAANPSTGDLWFYHFYGATSGVYRYHSGSWTNYTTNDGLPSNTLTGMTVDSSGNVWVASNSGAAKFNGSSWTTWTTANSSLASNYINQIAEDNSHRIWFTYINDMTYSSEGGASIYDPSTSEWSYYSAKNGDDDFSDIRKVFFLGDDLWATTGNYANGFIILDQNDLKATIYGQVGGTTVEKAGRYEKAAAKKKKVKVYALTKGSKKIKPYVVYRGTTSGGWYKSLNLKVGNKYKIKVEGEKGKNFKLRTGEPVRLDF